MTALQTISLGTPPQATDGDTARTAFTKVNSNVGVLNSQLALTSATTITQAQALTNQHVGQRVNINLSSAAAVSMPPASTCAPDNVVLLRNIGTASVTLPAASGSGDSVALSKLNPGETALMDTDGVHTWSVLMRGRTNSDNEIVNGSLTTGARPTFNGNLAWDAGNFNPANYAPVASPIITGNVTFPSGNLSLTQATASIELGSSATVNTPFIDFHSSGSNRDYDVRIIASGGSTTLDGQGRLEFNAVGGCTFDGAVGCASNVICQNGSLWSYGYSGLNSEGVLYLNSAGSAYIFGNTGGIAISSPNGAVNITSPIVPLRLQNSGASGYWQIGPDGSNNLIVYNSNGVGMFMGWGATSWSIGSDERIKNIQSPITDAVSAVESIRTVRYTLKSDKSESPRVFIGTIAQDVQNEFPELVSEREGILGVEYDGLSVVALAAIKELSVRVKHLEALLAARGTAA